MSKMFNSIIRLCLVVVVFNVILTPSEGIRNKDDYGSEYETRGYIQQAKQMSLAASSVLGNIATHRGLGLSAWGIVTVIISIMLAIAGMYYFSICYPVLCQRQRKFNVLGEPIV